MYEVVDLNVVTQVDGTDRLRLRYENARILRDDGRVFRLLDGVDNVGHRDVVS